MSNPESNSSHTSGLWAFLFSLPSLTIVAAIGTYVFAEFHFSNPKPDGFQQTSPANGADSKTWVRSWDDPFSIEDPLAFLAKPEQIRQHHRHWLEVSNLASLASDGRAKVLLVIASSSPYQTGVEGRIRRRVLASFLMIMSMSPWIDAWAWPAQLRVLGLLTCLLVLVPPVLATLSSAALRKRILIHARFRKTKRDVIERIERLDTGCFAPLSEQPVFKVSAIALGGSGVATLLQFLLY